MSRQQQARAKRAGKVHSRAARVSSKPAQIAPLPAHRVRHAAQPGFQYKVTCSKADVTIMGGAANCGKSRVLLLEGARDTHNTPGMGAVFFRRTTPEITNEGGLWDESHKVYPDLGGAATTSPAHQWKFPRGGKVTFHHLQHDDSVIPWQGAQCPLFLFDELTHFTAKQFWYLFSRNRSNVIKNVTLPDGSVSRRRIRARIIASCNPDADSWVADLIAWWIDQEPTLPDGQTNPRYGFAIPERAGVLRYFTRVQEQLVWGATKAEVMAQAPGTEEIDVRSMTFIPGKIEDNKLGDPRYRGQLMAMSRVERGRLLDGNWKIRATAGEVYKREDARLLKEPPPESDLVNVVRRWDLAATEPGETNKDPDWTVGVKMAKRISTGKIVVLHVERMRKRSDEVRRRVRATAEVDGEGVRVIIPQDPGQAGVDQLISYVTLLEGFSVDGDRETGDKFTRQDPFSAQWQHGNVEVVEGPWNAAFFGIMEAFPTKGVHDDDVDACAGAYRAVISGRSASMFD